ncbi:MAG: hypothetical protein K0S38_631 [Candidatus Paceibacter sp.]|jgi:hypothetical protein|nr:hypothetical protein [Candidatus Paceibacter sp.]
MKKTTGVIGFYVSVLAVILFCIGIGLIALKFALLLATFGFLADAQNSFITDSTVENASLIISIVLAFISMPFLIIGKIEYKRNPELYVGDKRINIGLTLSTILIILFGIFVLLKVLDATVLKSMREKDYQDYLVESENIPVTCKEPCENPVVLFEDKTLSFTLTNNTQGYITLDGFASTGSCKGGYIDTYQTDIMTDPAKLDPVSNFSIPLNVGQKVKIFMKCQDIGPASNEFFEGPTPWMLTESGQRLYFHFPMSGPRLK